MVEHWFVFFFFKQKTAYELRMSDWSSDVCSSDLHVGAEQRRRDQQQHEREPALIEAGPFAACLAVDRHARRCRAVIPPPAQRRRSEERRVGKECVST